MTYAPIFIKENIMCLTTRKVAFPKKKKNERSVLHCLKLCNISEIWIIIPQNSLPDNYKICLDKGYI